MAETLPKVWNTRFPSDSRAFAHLDFRLPDDELSNRVLVSDAFNYPNGKPLPASLVPECIFSKTPGDPLNDRNWVHITGGLSIVSERFRGVLVNFGLGTTQLFEVPYVDRQGFPRPGRWYLFHISEMKSCLVPEKSIGLKQGEIDPTKWDTGWFEKELLAVRAGSSEGVDLWLDPHIPRRIFLSDRLKLALKAAGISSPGTTLHRCLVVA